MPIAAALLLAVVAAGALAQQSCPTKPIRFILPNAFYNSINIAPHVRSGKLKALAIAGETRSPVLPQVPAFREAGLPGFDVRNWFELKRAA